MEKPIEGLTIRAQDFEDALKNYEDALRAFLPETHPEDFDVYDTAECVERDTWAFAEVSHIRLLWDNHFKSLAKELDFRAGLMVD